MQNQDNRVNQFISVYFKQAWTCNTKYYSVCPSWTCGQLVTRLNFIIAADFNIDPSQIQLVPFGQPKAEHGDPVDIYGTYTSTQLRELWSSNLEMGFYIRKAVSQLDNDIESNIQ